MMLEREREKKIEFLAGKHFWNYAGTNIYTDVLYTFLIFYLESGLISTFCMCVFVCM